jgi:phage FluMu protein Com
MSESQSVKCPQCDMVKTKDTWAGMTGVALVPNVLISCPACERTLIYNGTRLMLIEIANPRCDRITAKLNQIDALLADIREDLEG